MRVEAYLPTQEAQTALADSRLTIQLVQQCMASNAILIAENTKFTLGHDYCVATTIQKPKHFITQWHATTAKGRKITVGQLAKRRGAQGFHGLAILDWQIKDWAIKDSSKSFENFSKEMHQAGPMNLLHKDVHLKHMEMTHWDVQNFNRLSMIGGYLMREFIPRNCDVATSQRCVNAENGDLAERINHIAMHYSYHKPGTVSRISNKNVQETEADRYSLDYRRTTKVL